MAEYQRNTGPAVESNFPLDPKEIARQVAATVRESMAAVLGVTLIPVRN